MSNAAYAGFFNRERGAHPAPPGGTAGCSEYRSPRMSSASDRAFGGPAGTAAAAGGTGAAATSPAVGAGGVGSVASLMGSVGTAQTAAVFFWAAFRHASTERRHCARSAIALCGQTTQHSRPWIVSSAMQLDCSFATRVRIENAHVCWSLYQARTLSCTLMRTQT